MIETNTSNEATRQTDPAVQDLLTELANIGSGKALTELADILGDRVDLDVPEAFVLPGDVDVICNRLNKIEENAIGVLQSFTGIEIEGKITFVMPPSARQKLFPSVNANPDETGRMGDKPESMLVAVGMVLSNSFLSAMGQELQMPIFGGEGSVVRGHLENILKDQLKGIYETGTVVTIVVNFTVANKTDQSKDSIVGYFLMLLAPQTLETIVRQGRLRLDDSR